MSQPTHQTAFPDSEVATSELPRNRDDRAAVEKALSLMETLFEVEVAGLSELARRTGLTKSTTFRLLGSFERRGVVVRDGGRYRLGPNVQRRAAERENPIFETLRDHLTPSLADLYAVTHETVHLTVLTGTETLCLNKIIGTRSAVAGVKVGGRMPAHRSAAGRVLLSRTPHALTAVLGGLADDAVWLEHELAEIRHRGVAIDRGAGASGALVIAAPVLGVQGQPIAALSITGSRLSLDLAAATATLRKVCYAASFARPAMGATTARYEARA